MDKRSLSFRFHLPKPIYCTRVDALVGEVVEPHTSLQHSTGYGMKSMFSREGVIITKLISPFFEVSDSEILVDLCAWLDDKTEE